MTKQYWLFKSEPGVFSITDLEKSKDRTTCWDGVRNYQARNFLSQKISVGDEIFFYHSNSDPSAIVGIAQVVKAGYPDLSAFDSKSDHFDEKSKLDNPTWYAVDIKHVETFKKPISLVDLKKNPKLKNMVLLQKGSRLSVQPVSENEWKAIVAMK